ncbi:hypothetical protein F0U62_28600 [Cystobacter fuscus]|uniref:hypothetical protein n=1 Tax=Cystobacter fuscus TaxID=43 RepID=UPI002B2CE807|nr:hypothetical protein F0U62_28600 [Cystobacter fuscus]
MRDPTPTWSGVRPALLLLLCLLSWGCSAIPPAPGDEIIDAYTGLTGLPFQDYVARLRTSPGNRIVDEVVKEL